MNVGIIVFSQTGNTLSVAERLMESLAAAGHAVTLERVEQEGDPQRPPAAPALKSVPDVRPYDAVIFASPVQAFSLAPVMKLYLSRVPGLAGKRVSCFVTQHLKKAWMGGNRAIRQIKAACRAGGADIAASGVVNWSSAIRDRQIEDIVGRLSAL